LHKDCLLCFVFHKKDSTVYMHERDNISWLYCNVNSERRVRVLSWIIARCKYRVGRISKYQQVWDREKESPQSEKSSLANDRAVASSYATIYLQKRPLIDGRHSRRALIMHAQVKPAYDDLFAHCIRYYHQRVISSLFLTIKRTVYFKTN